MKSSFKLALVNSNKLLAHFTSQLHQQKQLLTAIKSVLPENLIEHVFYSVVSSQKVLVYTDKSIWASQLRFYSSVMLQQAKSQKVYADVERIQIKVLANLSKIPPISRMANLPAPETTRMIKQSIRGATQDPLNQALNKLCLTLERLSQ